jgi:hypothetical protein
MRDRRARSVAVATVVASMALATTSLVQWAAVYTRSTPTSPESPYATSVPTCEPLSSATPAAMAKSCTVCAEGSECQSASFWKGRKRHGPPPSLGRCRPITGLSTLSIASAAA